MTTHKALLLTKKLDVADLQTELAAEQKTAAGADSAQETLKSNLKVQTEVTAAALDAAYASASTKLDAMIGEGPGLEFRGYAARWLHAA